MSEERRCLTRIYTKAGPVYAVFEDTETIYRVLKSGDEFVIATTWSGSELLPPESIVIRSSEIAAVQEISEESWAWQKMVNAQHYATQLEDSPSEVTAKATARMVALLEDLK